MSEQTNYEDVARVPAAPVDGFDVDAFEESTTTEYVVKHPKTGEPTSLVLTLAGVEHGVRKKIVHARAREMRKAFAKTQQMPVSDPADDEAEEKEFIAKCILGWRGLVRDGKEVPYTPQGAYQLVYPSEKRWLRDQVKIALDERESFIKTCATN